MGAESRVWVYVIVGKGEWREVSAVTLAEAEEEAAKSPGVVAVIDSTYDKPDGDRGLIWPCR